MSAEKTGWKLASTLVEGSDLSMQSDSCRTMGRFILIVLVSISFHPVLVEDFPDTGYDGGTPWGRFLVVDVLEVGPVGDKAASPDLGPADRRLVPDQLVILRWKGPIAYGSIL